MEYLRVIPRDLFNESKLLKCMGQLALKVLDGMLPPGVTVTIDDTGEPFDVRLLDDGYLCLSNYETFVNGRLTTFKTVYNSKSNYPLYCVHPDSLEDIEVFDEHGNFTAEFSAMSTL